MTEYYLLLQRVLTCNQRGTKTWC